MAHGLGHSQRTEAKLQVKVDPKLVLSSYLLQLGRHELEQAIETELTDNPALERLHDEEEPLLDEIILKAVAPQELAPGSEDFEFYRSLPRDDDAPTWIDLAAAESSLHDHLSAQLLPALPAELRALGEYVVACVNDKGYLETPIEEIALDTNSLLEDVEKVVACLRECDPAGVGAATVQECLLLQLKDADTLEKRLARTILRSHMDEFLARKTQRIMRRYRVMPEVVEAAFEEILSLTPFPGEGFAASSAVVQNSKAVSVSPDLVFTYSPQGWEIHVKGIDPNTLNVNRFYRQRYRQLSESTRADAHEKRHVGQYVQRANTFIQGIHQRRVTLRRIGEYLLNHQPSFVSTGGYEFLRPLTRSRMAKDLGLHESTVSRATMNKFVQLANGETVSFEVFFKPALRVQKMIEEILQTENPNNPLSDDKIAQLLSEKGVDVARRTVNKYRDRTKLLSSRKRRSA